VPFPGSARFISAKALDPATELILITRPGSIFDAFNSRRGTRLHVHFSLIDNYIYIIHLKID
jgi:hypothetical protein